MIDDTMQKNNMMIHRFLISMIIFLLGVLLPTALPSYAQERDAAEYEVKAAFLFNFAKYT